MNWRPVISGDEGFGSPAVMVEEVNPGHDDSMRYLRAARPFALALEELFIPLRVAFPRLLVVSLPATLLDVFVDLYELVYVFRVRPHLEHDSDQGHVYSCKRLLRDISTITVLHAGRAVYVLTGIEWLWLFGQIVRCVRVLDLSAVRLGPRS